MTHDPISDIRNQFNDIDKNILILLSARSQLSKKIAKLKKIENVNAIQLNVWKQQMENRSKENESLKLDSDFMTNVFNLIHEESVRIQIQELKKLK